MVPTDRSMVELERAMVTLSLLQTLILILQLETSFHSEVAVPLYLHAMEIA